MVDWLYQFLGTIWQGIQGSFVHIFTTNQSSLGVAAIGSFFGAVGGYAIIQLTNFRKEIRSKVIAINTAITTSHMILNTFLGLKKQHLKSLCQRYNESKVEYDNVQVDQPHSGTAIVTSLDFQTLNFPPINLPLINSKLFEKTDLPSRSLFLAMTLVNSIEQLKALLVSRDSIIEEMNAIVSQSDLDNNEKNRFMVHLYFGKTYNLPEGNNICYRKYSDTMEAIEGINDSCIWFSKELAEELVNVGNNTATKLRIFRPRVGSVDYSDVEADLMPNDEDFKDWREKFIAM